MIAQKSQPQPTSYMKWNFLSIKNFNIKKPMKVPKEILKEYFYSLDLAKAFLDKRQNAETKKEKNDRFNYIKT